MGGGGGKGGSQTTTVRLPESLERGSNAAMSAAFQSASLPYSPNRGVTIAALAPQQLAAMQGTNAAASAFGLPSVQNPDTYLPRPELTAGGFQGYSTGGLYDEMIARSMTEQDMLARQRLLQNYNIMGNDIARRAGLGTQDIYGGLGPMLVPQPTAPQSQQQRDDGGNFNDQYVHNPNGTIGLGMFDNFGFPEFNGDFGGGGNSRGGGK